MHLILGGLRERIASNGAQGAVVVDDPAKAGTVVSRILDACFSIVGQNLLFGHGEFNLSRKTLRQSCLVCHHQSKTKVPHMVFKKWDKFWILVINNKVRQLQLIDRQQQTKTVGQDLLSGC